MSEARPKRRYDSTRRQEQRDRTRATVVEAAARLFVQRGYAGATVPLIAEAAGVSVETVYRAAPGKAGLLDAAVQAALAGGVRRSALPVDERPGIRRVIDAPDARARLAAYAHTQPGVWRRVGPLLRVLDAAAPSDGGLEALRTQLTAQRRDGMLQFARLLDEAGELRPGLTAELARDLLFTICARANYESLVELLGWDEAAYERWLVDTLTHALLPPRPMT
jgi:AcrR family transcriptional regulator